MRCHSGLPQVWYKCQSCLPKVVLLCVALPGETPLLLGLSDRASVPTVARPNTVRSKYCDIWGSSKNVSLILFSCAGRFQSQRVRTVEQALVGGSLNVDALLAALQALPKSLFPSPTPGEITSLLVARGHLDPIVTPICILHLYSWM